MSGMVFRIDISIFDPGLFWNILGYSILAESVLNFQGQYASPGVMSELALWMTTCSAHSIVSSLCVYLTGHLTWIIMHGILPISTIKKGSVYFPGQLYVQNPENTVNQSGKFSYFWKKSLSCLLGIKQLYLLTRYSMRPNNLCVACFLNARFWWMKL